MQMTRERAPVCDTGLARRADRRLRRYGTDLNGVLSILVSIRHIPSELRPAVPSSLSFVTQGHRFVADVTPDGDRYCAVVRGHPECFTEGGNEVELRKYLVEVTDAMLFGLGEKVAQ